MVSEMNTTADSWVNVVGSGEIFGVLGMLFGVILILMLCFGGLSIAFVKALQGGGSTRKLREFEARDAQTFQNLQRGFKRMEERIDSLETLFIGTSTSRSYDREFD